MFLYYFNFSFIYNKFNYKKTTTETNYIDNIKIILNIWVILFVVSFSEKNTIVERGKLRNSFLRKVILKKVMYNNLIVIAVDVYYYLLITVICKW